MEQGRARRRLGDILVDHGVLTQAQVSELLQERTTIDGRLERLGEAAVRLGHATADEIGMVLAQQLGLEYLSDQALPVDPELARRAPASLVERHLVVPLWREDDAVVVACADPTDVIGLDDVRVAIGARRLRVVVAPLFVLRQAISDSFGLEFATEGLVEELDEQADAEDLEELDASDGPVRRLAEEIITNAVRSRASDVHIEPKLDRCVVRHRIDGVLHEIMSLPRSITAPLISRVKLIAGLDIAEKRRPQDGRSHFRGRAGHVDEAVDMRLSTLPSMFGESVVIRLLRREAGRHTLADIGLDAEQTTRMLSAVEQPQGLVLVTGPTGSGKTSTLYGLLAHLATNERKLITVEDPVEYELDGIVQTQVNERAGYTMTRALRAMLRQDPDVVMVGEIRDPETAELGLQAALTGHLVLSTLHTNDAPSAVVRMAELGMPGYLIASALTMVIAQRLARQVCTDCAEPAGPSDHHRQALSLRSGAEGFLVGRGCLACNGTGYMGRTATFELLSVDDRLRDLISAGASTGAISQAARRAGMRSLREDGLQKASRGITSLDEVLRVTPQTEHIQDHCPVCVRQIEDEYVTCPWCGADLRPLQCHECARPLDPAWIACPGCGTPTAIDGDVGPTDDAEEDAAEWDAVPRQPSARTGAK